MSGTSTHGAKQNAGIPRDSPKSSLKKQESKSVANASNLRSSKDSKSKLPPFKVSSNMARSNPSQGGLAKAGSAGLKSDGR